MKKLFITACMLPMAVVAQDSCPSALTIMKDCPGTSLPYVENWATEDGFSNWKKYSADTYREWDYFNAANLNDDPKPDAVAISFPSIDGKGAKDEWLVSPRLSFHKDSIYEVSITYNALEAGFGSINESFSTNLLKRDNPILSEKTVLGKIEGIIENGSFTEPYNKDLASTITYSFSPDTTGSYFFGFHADAPKSTGMLVIYEIRVREAPLN